VTLLAWLSTRYDYQADWTTNNRHTISKNSQILLNKFTLDIEIQAYASPDLELHRAINMLISRYKKYKNNINLKFSDPNKVPQEIREYGITKDGELLIKYQGRSEHITNLTEQAMSQALQRLLRVENRWLGFLEGHGERSTTAKNIYDISLFVEYVKKLGFNISNINFAKSSSIPNNIEFLVIASPLNTYLENEVKLIHDYVEKGGNLLWLLEPESIYGLGSLAEQLGLRVKPGVLISPASSLLAHEDPSIILINKYNKHPLTKLLADNLVSIFAESCGLNVELPEEWEIKPFLTTEENIWSENSVIKNDKIIEFNPDADLAGAFDIGITLERSVKKQRIILIGDGDFISNAYLEQVGNLDLAYAITNWLAHDDNLIDIPIKINSDAKLELSEKASIFIVVIFLIIMPLTLLIIGLAKTSIFYNFIDTLRKTKM
jgi:ABC-type uncharacterized transport system involved in gliding motility auxiliary subunit